MQLFDESIDKNEEKTWNPDPDGLLKEPPVYFRHANDYWSTKLACCSDEFLSKLLLR